MQLPPHPRKDKHWPSKEFDQFINYAINTSSHAKYLQCLKEAYLLAKREAHPETITAGSSGSFLGVRCFTDVMYDGKMGIYLSYPINLEELRCILENYKLLDDEDSPE